ncbi:MAG: LysE family translocator [Rhodospirillales bacterium]|nr:LysE family translocator [Rhodospirillales bacterium]
MADIYWFVFLAASLLIIITPGQDMVLVMSRSLSQGSLAGIVTAAGVSIGLMGHTVLATLGLGAILQASGALFLILKLVGAAYLIYLGIQLLRSKQTSDFSSQNNTLCAAYLSKELFPTCPIPRSPCSISPSCRNS